jgi:dephospho-CoA kinase
MYTPLKVGITGGIGSGKSIVCRVLETMGYPVYNSDLRARSLMENDPEIRASLIAAFGEEAFAGNTLNRAYLAQKVFDDPAQRETINGIVHPAVRKDFQRWASRQPQPFVFQESALLFETNARRLMDVVVLVTAPAEQRIRRVQLRDGSDEKAVRARMASQLPDEEKIPLADFVIDNSDGAMVVPQVNALLEMLLSSSPSASLQRRK